MSVTDLLKDQRRTLEAKVAALRDEIANIDVALKAISDRKDAKPASSPVSLTSARPASGTVANGTVTNRVS